MKMMIAVLAGVALIVFDYIAITELFIYSSKGGELLFPIVVAGINIGLWLQRQWLVFTFQTIVSLLLLYEIWLSSKEGDFGDVAQLILWISLGHLLAWLIARAIPMRAAAQ